jgi:hypothetical protein
MAILTNPETGVEYDDITGDSTKRFVAVDSAGVVLDTRGEKWPYGDGAPHKKSYEFFLVEPFEGAGYDSEKLYVKSAQVLERYEPQPPIGHPQGIYKTVQSLHLLPRETLKSNAFEKFKQMQRTVWPQDDPSYDKVLSIATKALASSGSGNPEIGSVEFFREVVETDERVEEALVNNRIRLAELNQEIDALEIDENGDLELDEHGQAKTPPNSIEFDRMLTLESSGWVNGVA